MPIDLATVLDCFSRKVVGWSIADHMRTDLVANALRMAARTRGGLDGSLFHSDHGAQYGARALADLCTQLGVTQSMGAVGTSADNAACESFHASLKRETLQGAHDYGDATTCRRTVFAWLSRYSTAAGTPPPATSAPTSTNADTTPLSSRSPRDQRIIAGAGSIPTSCCVSALSVAASALSGQSVCVHGKARPPRLKQSERTSGSVKISV